MSCCKKTKILVRGVIVVEAMIALSIGVLVLVYSGYTIVAFARASSDAADRKQAVYLASEIVEGVRYRRDDDWATFDALTNSTQYSLSYSPSDITIEATPQVVGEFTRIFTVEDVYRDATSKDIVPSGTPGSVLDTETRIVTATVSWDTGTKSVVLETILTNIDI